MSVPTLRLAVFSALGFAVLPLQAQFSPGPNPITSSVGGQTLAGGTGTINSGGTVSTSGSSVAVAISGTSTLNNNGTIQQTGTGRAIDNAVANSNLTVNNTGTITTISTDAFRVNADSAVNLTNSGTISVSAGGQAIDWAAIATKSNTLTNQSTGVISAVGDDAVRPGTNGLVSNAGNITATPTGGASPSGSDGIDLRTFSGISVSNSGTISGRHGIATDGANAVSTFTLTSNTGTIQGVNGSGLNIDDANLSNGLADVLATVTNSAGGTIRGGVLAVATAGDGDGIDVDGVLNLNNSGDVLGFGAKGPGSDGGANTAEGLAVGGGTIINNASGRIIGSSLAADAPNGDSTRDGRGITVDNSSGGNALAATTITNSGLIQGRSGYGIRIIGTFGDTITNNAGGTIRGANNATTTAVIQTGDGDDSINNLGSIIHDGGSAQTAIATEGGNDQVKISSGTATVVGGIDGGSGGETTGDVLFFNLGSAANAFSLAGSISNFEQVQVVSGRTTLTGSNTYAGTTLVGAGASAARLQMDGAHAGGGNYTVTTGGTLAGKGSIALAAAGNSITVDLQGALAPGGETETGRLTLALGSVQLNGTIAFRLGGTTAGVANGYDQLTLAAANDGTFTLGGSSQLVIDLGFAPSDAVSFILIDLANAATTVSGTFAGLPEGATFTQGGRQFAITYRGGTGNDVVVTTVPEPGTWSLLALGSGLLLWKMGRRRKSA